MTDSALSQAIDDDSSSAGSFAIVADDNNGDNHHSFSNEKQLIRKLANQMEPNDMYSQPPVIFEVAKVAYHDFSVGIFTESYKRNPRRFYFEPIALIDPKNIVNESHGFFKQDFVRFTIEMWNSEIRSKVLERVTSLPDYKDLEIHEDDISVMPY